MSAPVVRRPSFVFARCLRACATLAALALCALATASYAAAPYRGRPVESVIRELARLTRDLSRQLNATYIQVEAGVQISGVYDRAITTPTGKIAVIRRQDVRRGKALLASARVTLACLDAARWRPVQMPAPLTQELENNT